MKKFILFWFLLFSCFWSASVLAANNLVTDTASVISEGDIQALNLQQSATQLDADNATLSLSQVDQTIQNTKRNLRSYEEQLQEMAFITPNDYSKIKRESLLTKIHNEKALLTINQQRRAILTETLHLLQKQLDAQSSQLHMLEMNYHRQQHFLKQSAVESKIAKLDEQQNYWLQQIISLNAEIDRQLKLPKGTSSKTYQQLLQRIFTAQENSNLMQLEISLMHDQAQLDLLHTDIGLLSVTDLTQKRQTLDDVGDQLQKSQDLIEDKLKILAGRHEILLRNPADQAALNELNQLTKRYQHYLQQTTDLLNVVNTQRENNTARLAKALASRQGLPGLSADEWVSLGQGFIQLAVVTYQATLGFAYDVVQNSAKLSDMRTFRLVVIGLILFGFAKFLRHYFYLLLKKFADRLQDIRGRFLYGFVRIIRAHFYFVAGMIWFLYFLQELQISEEIYNVVFNLLNAYLIFSVAFSAARIALYENLAANAGDDVRLYFRLRWTLAFGAIVTVLSVLAQQLDVIYEVQDFFNRFFMLFVLILALLLLKAWQVLPKLIIPYINPKHQYLVTLTKLLGVVIPLIILSNAILGLIGYVELAWTISRYEGLFLFMAFLYVIIKGILSDLLGYFSDWCIKRYRGGWLVSEALLKPINFWIQIALFLAVTYLLLYLYGLPQQSYIVEYGHRLLRFTVIHYSNLNITTWVLIKALIVVLFFVWATRWSREFCYRKLYQNVRDIGARNSLAIFTQYGVIILGGLVTLKVLEIDLTAAAFVITGLAVGLGFGLRDLANNFVCGLLLLIERPMRRGDTVTLGDYDGVVVNIGLRAITIYASDNREVLVPNSEAFTKTFINWTHQDDVIRCEAPIKISRQDDPHLVQEQILEVVKNTKGVLARPAPDVLLTSMANSVLEFEARFFINYRINNSRMVMRSLVLFNIWDRFRELSVKPPYPVVIEKNSEE